MILFQVIALTILAGLTMVTFLAAVFGRATRREALFWGLIWVAAGAAIIWYEKTTDLAKAVGIGRGADLVLYCSVVTMMAGFMVVYLRLRRLGREMTLIVRHLALKDAEGRGGAVQERN